MAQARALTARPQPLPLLLIGHIVLDFVVDEFCLKQQREQREQRLIGLRPLGCGLPDLLQHELVQLYGGYSSPVGYFTGGKSWAGRFDMAGNAYEWTSTTITASNGIESGTSVNSVRGGSWYALANSCKSTNRAVGRAASGDYHSVGFRVAARPK